MRVGSQRNLPIATLLTFFMVKRNHAMMSKTLFTLVTNDAKSTSTLLPYKVIRLVEEGEPCVTKVIRF